MSGNDVPLEQYAGVSYSDHLRELLILIDATSIELRQSYLYYIENRTAHYKLVSLLVQAYLDLVPKVANNPLLSKKFIRWTRVADNPRLLLQPKYEKLVWELQLLIREAYEHLGITTID